MIIAPYINRFNDRFKSIFIIFKSLVRNGVVKCYDICPIIISEFINEMFDNFASVIALPVILPLRSITMEKLFIDGCFCLVLQS